MLVLTIRPQHNALVWYRDGSILTLYSLVSGTQGQAVARQSSDVSIAASVGSGIIFYNRRDIDCARVVAAKDGRLLVASVRIGIEHGGAMFVQQRQTHTVEIALSEFGRLKSVARCKDDNEAVARVGTEMYRRACVLDLATPRISGTGNASRRRAALAIEISNADLARAKSA